MLRRTQFTIGYTLAAAAILAIAAFALVSQADAQHTMTVGEKVRLCVEDRRESGYFDHNLTWEQRRAIRLQFRICIHNAVWGNNGQSSSSSMSSSSSSLSSISSSSSRSSTGSSVSSPSSSSVSSTSSPSSMSSSSVSSITSMSSSLSSSSLSSSSLSSISSSLSSSSSSQVTAHVTIDNNDYHPRTIFVKKGTAVHWMNSDTIPHTVTSTNNNTLNSGAISASGSYSYTFNNTGIYQYHCTFHPDMTGAVVVTN